MPQITFLNLKFTFYKPGVWDLIYGFLYPEASLFRRLTKYLLFKISKRTQKSYSAGVNFIIRCYAVRSFCKKTFMIDVWHGCIHVSAFFLKSCWLNLGLNSLTTSLLIKNVKFEINTFLQHLVIIYHDFCNELELIVTLAFFFQCSLVERIFLC